jgi:hypothetical protein
MSRPNAFSASKIAWTVFICVLLPSACGLSSLDGLRDGVGRPADSGPASDEGAQPDEDANTDEDAGGAAEDDGPVVVEEDAGSGEVAAEPDGEIDAVDGSEMDVGAPPIDAADADTGCQAVSCMAQHGTPYGMPIPLPGRLEAENYDVGGEGISYHDTTPANIFGKYRTSPNEGVDVEDRCSGNPNTCFDVTAIDPGEWSEYTIAVATTGTYSIKLGVAAPSVSHMHIEVDGSDASGPIAVMPTNNLFVAQVTGLTLGLSQGRHIMRLVFDEVGISLNWIEFAVVAPG